MYVLVALSNSGIYIQMNFQINKSVSHPFNIFSATIHIYVLLFLYTLRVVRMEVVKKSWDILQTYSDARLIWPFVYLTNRAWVMLFVEAILQRKL